MKPSANWIWLDDTHYPEYQKSKYTYFCEDGGLRYSVVTFKKTISINKPVKSVKAFVSGDAKYTLYINGKLTIRGPAAVGGDYDNRQPMPYWFYDETDLDFSMGENLVTANVVLQPEVPCDCSMGHGGFMFEAHIAYADGTSEVVATDETWLCGIDRRYQKPYTYIACRNVSITPPVDFKPARVTPCVWNLIPKEIPNLIQRRIAFGELIVPYASNQQRVSAKSGVITLLPGAPAHLVLDFGRVYSAYISLEVSAEENVALRIGAQEIIGRTDKTEYLSLRAGKTAFDSLNMYSARYLDISTSNFTKPFTLKVDLIFTAYPFEFAGEFECSDASLNKIFDVCRWTNVLCRQSLHLDSPMHLEPLGCTGDYYIESLMNYYCFGDKWLTRLDILRTAWLIEEKDANMFHPSYSLIWTEMIRDYVLYTGDSGILARVRSAVELVLKRFMSYVGDSGIVDDPPNFMFMDWVYVGEYCLHHPPKVLGQGYISAFFYRALQNGAYFCTRLGDAQAAEFYEKTAEQVKAAFNRLLWDEEKGLYCEGKNGATVYEEKPWLPYGDGLYFGQHTNTLAVLFGLAPDEQCGVIMEKVMTDTSLFQAQPYFMHFVFGALHKAGFFEKYGNDQIRRWSQLIAECDTSLKEVWSGFDCDYSHAWGGTPAYQLPARILGVVPVDDGFKQVRISPVLGDLEWARGKIPTPYGIIEVDCRSGVTEVRLPDGVERVR